MFPSFSEEMTKEPGNRAFFGVNVLQGLVDGIDDFLEGRQERWVYRTHRVGGPALLGCSPWVNDQKLLEMIERTPAACVVTGKRPEGHVEGRQWRTLREINGRTHGMEVRALPGLSLLAPREADGRPRIVGPYDRIQEEGVALPTFRTVGERKTAPAYRPVPFAHAKLAVLGNICWTDEHPSGALVDEVFFWPRRLWVSSANFTYQSRTSAEFGYWTEHTDLVTATTRFLVELIGCSEDLDSTADESDPELVEVELDHAAMAEAAYESEMARIEREEIDADELP